MAKSTSIDFGKRGEDGKTDNLGSVSFSFPESVDEAVQMYGESVVLDLALRSVKIDVQNIARRSDNVEEAQKAVDSYTPGVSRRGAGGMSQKAISDKLKELRSEDPEKFAQILAALEAAG